MAVAATCAPVSPNSRQVKPAISAPTSGAKREDRFHLAAQPFHHVDVFHCDGAAVAEEAHKDRQTDRRLPAGGHGQDEQGEDLSGQVAEEGRKKATRLC